MMVMAGDQFSLRTRDLDQVRHLVGEIFCPFTLTPHGRGHQTTISHRSLGDVGFTRIAHNGEVEIDVRAGALPRFLVQHVTRGGFAANGVMASTSCAQLAQPQDPLRMRASADCEFRVISLPADGVLAAARALSGNDHLDLARTFPAAITMSSTVSDYLDMLEREAGAPASDFASGLGAQQAQQMLIALLMPGIAVRGRQPARAWYVKRAEDHMMANIASDLGIADVVAAAGVGMRTLYHGFQQTHGMTPMTWLKQRRLDAARADLLVGDPAAPVEGGQVTRSAARWGFSHLGRFATDYRRRFGETPVQTVRRAR
jgi:AraC-like DNA-binding protein